MTRIAIPTQPRTITAPIRYHNESTGVWEQAERQRSRLRRRRKGRKRGTYSGCDGPVTQGRGLPRPFQVGGDTVLACSARRDRCCGATESQPRLSQAGFEGQTDRALAHHSHITPSHADRPSCAPLPRMMMPDATTNRSDIVKRSKVRTCRIDKWRWWAANLTPRRPDRTEIMTM